jgi:Spy/CpxP family protein refolding chaperone
MTGKLKWMIWAIVVLFLMNAATLGTILYHNYKQVTPTDRITSAAPYAGNALNGRFFRQTLGFTNGQMDGFRNANEKFRPQTAALTLSIDSLKAEMFKEMGKANPDTLRLNALSNEIGNLHSELKRETYQFFLKIRTVCTEEQASQLEKVFEPLFVNENISTGPRGHQRGWNRANN